MFLAEADYIKKYTNTDATLDVTSIGVQKADTMYQYTIDADKCIDCGACAAGCPVEAIAEA